MKAQVALNISNTHQSNVIFISKKPALTGGEAGGKFQAVSHDSSMNKGVSRKERRTESMHTMRAAAVSTTDLEERTRHLAALLKDYREEKITLTILRGEFSGEYNSWKALKYERSKSSGSVIDAAFESFPSFLLHMGVRPDSTYSVDRIDNSNPHYSPQNCRWATKEQQSANRSNTLRLTDIAGETLTVTEWAQRLNISPSTIRNRKAKGWTEDECIHGRQRQEAPHTEDRLGRVIDVWQQSFRRQGSFFAASHQDRKQLATIASMFEAAGLDPAEGSLALLINWNRFRHQLATTLALWDKTIPQVPSVKFVAKNAGEAVSFALTMVREARLGSRHDFIRQQCREVPGFEYSHRVLRQLTALECSGDEAKKLAAIWREDPEIWTEFVQDFTDSNPESDQYEVDEIPIHFFVKWLQLQLKHELLEEVAKARKLYEEWEPGHSSSLASK